MVQIFLDTATLEEIGKYYDTGIIDGVTTNPSLAAKVDASPDGLIFDITNKYDLRSVSVQMISEFAYDMVEEAGRRMYHIKEKLRPKFHRAITIKLPCTAEGFKACKELSSKGIKVNMTLCFSLSQAILAAKVGASYVSPFIGRLEDAGYDGINLLEDIVNSYYKHNYKTQVLAASIRNLDQIEGAILAGVNAITIPLNILEEMMLNELTIKGQAKFLEDARKND